MLRKDYEQKQSRGPCSKCVCILAILVVAIGLYAWLAQPGVPRRTILTADFEKGMIEQVPDDPVARVLLGKKLTVRGVVEALETAAKDDRVKAFVARVGESGMSFAQVQAVRDAVIAFRKSGKPAVAYAETFGEAGPGNASYYLATAFDTISLQPSGDVGLTGLIAEQPFLRGTLDKLGIIPRIEARKQYKSFRNLFTERHYTAPHREEVRALMDSQFGQLVAGIAKARGLSEDQVRTLINRGPFIGKDAVDAKLVDALAYRGEVYAKVRALAGSGAETLSLATYQKRTGNPYTHGTKVALIYAVGEIERGESGYQAATGRTFLGSDTLCAAIRQAVKDDGVKAIVLRIDSPGGSYVASDAIWREVGNAEKAGKPVIASMGSVAASGGYFIAAAADKIVAEPATITGSIGVLGGKFITTAFWRKLGVTWDEVHTSANANVWTQTSDLSPAQEARFGVWLDRIYDDFVSKVSIGRRLTKDAVEKIAKGRVWSGEDAKRLGLVDELGGFPEALVLVRRALKLPDTAPLKLTVIPRRKGLFARLSSLGAIATGVEAPAALSRTIRALQPAMRAVESLEPREPGELRMQDGE